MRNEKPGATVPPVYCTPTTTPATGIAEDADRRPAGLAVTDDLPDGPAVLGVLTSGPWQV
jgi:hypothetical protein